MELSNLKDLMMHDLKDIYNAEGQLAKALPKMAKAATNPELKAAFEAHLEETKVQIERLEQVMEMLEMPIRGKKCKAMEGLLEEGKEVMGEDASEDVMDAALIGAAQKVEHYEIATYGTICTYAELLGLEQAKKLLGQNLDEEEKTDEKLSELAETIINVEAAQGD